MSTKVCSESSTVSEGPDVEGTATVEKANNKDCVEACRCASHYRLVHVYYIGTSLLHFCLWRKDLTCAF